MDELISRTMPHDMVAEQAVLGSLLIDERCIHKVMGALRPEDFYLRQNREIYETICSMYSFSETIDPVTVLDKMKQNGVYDEATSYDYIRQLMLITPTAANVDNYIDIVRDKSLLRQVAEVAAGITEMVREGQATSQEALELAEQRIFNIRQGRSVEGLEEISTIIQSTYQRLNELAASGSDIPGLSTGFPDLDRVIAGLNPSDLVILAARPSVGKSSLALNILLNVGKRFRDKSVAFFSLEMSKVQLAMRLISGESFVELQRLITGRLGEEDWSKVAAATASLSQTRIYIDDNPMLTVADMKSKCRRLDNLGLVVIDYLQLMTSAGGPIRNGDNRQQIVSDISRALKIMAKDLNVPVLCLSQLSRASESSDKRPMLSHLRESGAIEQDADIVMFLYRDKDNEGEDNHNIVECIVAKNRHGPTDTLELQWIPEYTTFTSVERRYEEY